MAKILVDGLPKNTTCFYKGWNCTVRVGRKSLVSSSLARWFKSEPMPRSTFRSLPKQNRTGKMLLWQVEVALMEVLLLALP